MDRRTGSLGILGLHFNDCASVLSGLSTSVCWHDRSCGSHTPVFIHRFPSPSLHHCQNISSTSKFPSVLHTTQILILASFTHLLKQCTAWQTPANGRAVISKVRTSSTRRSRSCCFHPFSFPGEGVALIHNLQTRSLWEKMEAALPFKQWILTGRRETN